MVVLDTTVVSELMRLLPDPAVEAWVAGRPAASLFFSAIGEAELRYGVAIMPAGRRRDRLVAEIEAMLRDDFEGRVLPFDSDAARFYAQVAAYRRLNRLLRKRNRVVETGLDLLKASTMLGL
ncbi:MAG: hypothetical protein OXF97_07330 [Nitrospira sp.]|nr:hypothetical protein [Nitrospira sp.]MCY4132386.1 hypothetical protein [Nitrospira sp.]